jgi:hypothetical protein
MGLLLFANNAATTLAGPITSGATTANLATGTGSLFPTPTGGNNYLGTFVDAATGLLNEIVSVTAMSGDTISTMVRGQEATTPKAWLAGDLFNNFITAGSMAAMVQVQTATPSRIVTASGAFTMSTNDANGTIGLNRTVAPASSSTTLPAVAIAGQTYTIQDLARNFQAFPVTVNFPGGQTGPGGVLSATLNVNGQSAHFTYYGSNQWGMDIT